MLALDINAQHFRRPRPQTHSTSYFQRVTFSLIWTSIKAC